MVWFCRTIYVVATADGQLHGIEGSTGERLWSFHTGSPLFSAFSKVDPTVPNITGLMPVPHTRKQFGGADSSEDSLLIPGRDGSLYAYLTASGVLKVVSCDVSSPL